MYTIHYVTSGPHNYGSYICGEIEQANQVFDDYVERYRNCKAYNITLADSEDDDNIIRQVTHNSSNIKKVVIKKYI